MDDLNWKRNEVDSPCVKLCSVHPVERICVGCFRTIDEISGWSKMPNDERMALIDDLPNRAGRLHKRRGGHFNRINQ